MNGQKNVRCPSKSFFKAVHNILHDDELDLYPVDVMYSKHIQIEGGAYVLNPPMATHSNRFLSDATRPGHYIDEQEQPRFYYDAYDEKGMTQKQVYNAKKRPIRACNTAPTVRLRPRTRGRSTK